MPIHRILGIVPRKPNDPPRRLATLALGHGRRGAGLLVHLFDVELLLGIVGIEVDLSLGCVWKMV